MAAIATPVSAEAWCELHQWGITEERVVEAVRRIVAACAPERIVAFGSWARGESRPESDLDLAVIVDEGSDVAASRHLPAILAGIRMSKDILVVDRCEHERMKVSRNSVHYFIATDGIVLMRGPAMDPQVEQLLLAAGDDRATIQLAVPVRVLGFHAQQAVEKLLKALIASHGSTFAWTHEIESLEVELTALGETLPVVPFPLLSLQPYAVAFRYAAVPVLLDSDRDDIRQTVDVILAHVKGRIDALKPKP